MFKSSSGSAAGDAVCVFIQAERVVRGSVRGEHHRGVRGLHGGGVRDVRPAQRSKRPAQDHQQSPGQGLSAGLLHRRKPWDAAKKPIKAASRRNPIRLKKKNETKQKYFYLILCLMTHHSISYHCRLQAPLTWRLLLSRSL